MPRLIICTVGTSLLSNRDDRPWAGWTALGGQPLPDASGVLDWLRGADVSRASAETNTLRALGLSSDDELALLHSETPEGRFCAESLRGYYAEGRRCREVAIEEIGMLGYGAKQFSAGLKSLVSITIGKIVSANRRGFQPVLCATGGFKAEIAFLNLLGALLGVEVVYMHELHRQLVTLPRLPLTWDAGFVDQHERFFDWIDEEPRRSDEVNPWLAAAPGLRVLVEEHDGHTFLSAAGDLLFRATRERTRDETPPETDRLPADKNRLSELAHHRPSGWQAFVDRLCEDKSVTLVRCDTAAFSHDPVKVVDGARGILRVRFGPSDGALPLRVETTARNHRQSEVIRDRLLALLQRHG
jgi:putative CRISPR-associated protein (TIGR02619 family)